MLQPNSHQTTNSNLSDIRVLAALTGGELFGHERGNIEVYLALREQGAQVQVGVRKDMDSEVERYLKELGFETFHLPFGNQWSLLWIKQYPLSIFEKINQLLNCSLIFLEQLRNFKPTHIHISSVMGFNYIFPALFLTNIPVIYRMGDAPPTDSVYSLNIWRLAMKKTTRFIAISDFVRNKILDQGILNSKVTKIYNFPPSRLVNTLGKKVNINSHTLIYVGQLSKQKGLWQLLKAFKKVNGCDLLIVGDSKFSSSFKNDLEEWVKLQRLEKNVTFCGQVANPFHVYQRSVLHIVPSIWEEPLGNVVLEAKQAGIPSVVFPSGGLPEMVRHQVDGYICADKTPEALAEAITWMLADGDRLAKMGEAAHEDYEDRFGKARFLEQWANIYLDTLKS